MGRCHDRYPPRDHHMAGACPVLLDHCRGCLLHPHLHLDWQRGCHRLLPLQLDSDGGFGLQPASHLAKELHRERHLLVGLTAHGVHCTALEVQHLHLPGAQLCQRHRLIQLETGAGAAASAPQVHSVNQDEALRPSLPMVPHKLDHSSQLPVLLLKHITNPQLRCRLFQAPYEDGASPRTTDRRFEQRTARIRADAIPYQGL
mmetsp:Transcript_36981/g.82208  ORF Transcript_36981/g.82208 Transcript_36981/m.82208 type:complete len:202 (-) Transcript_36981:165-770(-)